MASANSQYPDPNQLDLFEPVLTIRRAAEIVGIKYWLLLRAVNNGDIPTYQLGNARRRVRLSDIEAAMITASTRTVKQ